MMLRRFRLTKRNNCNEKQSFEQHHKNDTSSLRAVYRSLITSRRPLHPADPSAPFCLLAHYNIICGRMQAELSICY